VADIAFPLQAGLERTAKFDELNTPDSFNRSATQQSLNQVKTLIPSFKPVTSDGTIGLQA
jgi:hypothetical protein